MLNFLRKGELNVMKFLRLLKNDFQRAICSYRFLFSVLAVTFLVSAIGCTQIGDVAGICHLVSRAVKGNGVDDVTRLVLPLVPFGMTFALEWKEKSYLFYVSRVGIERYILSKMIVTAVSGMLMTLVGTAMAIPILRALAPELPIVTTGDANFYSHFLKEGKVVFGFFLFVLNFALTSCFASFCGVCFSTYVPNPVAVLASPMLIYYTLIRFGPIYEIPGIFEKYIFFNPVFWVNATYPTDSPAMQLGYHFGNAVMYFVVFSFLAIRQTKRRVLNG